MTAILKPFFFHLPDFSLNRGAIFLKLALYRRWYAVVRRFGLFDGTSDISAVTGIDISELRAVQKLKVFFHCHRYCCHDHLLLVVLAAVIPAAMSAAVFAS